MAVRLSGLGAGKLFRVGAAVFAAAVALVSVLLGFVPGVDWGALFYTFPAFRVAEFICGRVPGHRDEEWLEAQVRRGRRCCGRHRLGSAPLKFQQALSTS
jgi:hypothetical protein